MTRMLVNSNTTLRAAIDAALIMAIGMGFGRFAFTAIYPYMVEEGVLSLKIGSLTASANYAGYLLGAFLAVKIRAHNSHQLCLWSTIGTVICLAILSISSSIPLIIFIRGVAGIFSSLAMVSASLWLLEHRKQEYHSPLLYSGVGLGIALSAELIVLGTSTGLDSKQLWLLLAVSSLLIALLAIPSLKKDIQISSNKSPIKSSFVHFTITQPLPLIILYGLAGFGYIITATYLPFLVKNALPELDSAHVWAIFGLGAIPSCFLWHRLHQKWGTRIALFANLSLQAFGVILPLLLPSTIGYLLSAFLVGGTFMGTVTITMPVAQHLARQAKNNLIAIMTIVYGIGQIIGPIVANTLFAVSHSLNSSLITACIALVIAALISLSGNIFFKRNN